MDPPETINISKDSTFVLGLEAQKRGYELFYYAPESLKLFHRQVSAMAAPIRLKNQKGNHFDLGTFEDTNLTQFDIILMRQNFNDPMSYNALTHILDHIADQTLILNDPTGVREAPEKLLITHYPNLAPPTLISRNLDDIRAFQKEHGDAVMKPLNGYGGKGIYHLKSNDDNISAVHEMLCELHTEPFVIQKYIPEIRQGDKRIIVIDGDPIGAVLRVPLSGNARGNLAAGGQPKKTTITEREREICDILKPELIRRGLVFVGLDTIGDYVTEINPKSPTGLQEINKLDGVTLEAQIWDAFEARFDQFKQKAA